ncbi:MAG TPA: T9SS type A sorting domain-containing protein [Flavobacteriales bacterium]|nr:T9SS type A sorting domain-containing protein [Flavobacteriales bacterium]
MNRTCILLLAVLSSATASAITVSVQVTHAAVCMYGGRIQGTIQGGIPPFEVQLSTGQVLMGSSVNFVFEDVPAGAHTITVTDAMSDLATDNFQIASYSSFPGPSFAFPLPQCNGGTVTALVLNWQGIYPDMGYGSIPGMAPLSFTGPFQSVQQAYPDCWGGDYLVEFTGTPGSQQTMGYTDANGCPGTLTTNIPFATSMPDAMLLDLTGSCSNTGTGTVTAATMGGAPFESRVRIILYRDNGTLFHAVCPAMSGPASNTSDFNLEHTFTGLTAGGYYLRVQAEHTSYPAANWGQVAWPSDCVADFPFTIPDLGPCAVVAGTAYVDNNLNCTFQQGSETRVPDAIIQVTPGPHFATTRSNGTYTVALPASGVYTMTLDHPAVEEHCVNAPIPFNATLGNTTTQNIATLPTVPLDVSLSMNSGAARPGFQLTHGMLVKNLTPASSGTTTLSLTFDPALSYINATPAPTTVNGNELTWVQGSMSGWSVRNYAVQLQVPPDVGLLGTQLLMQGSVTTTEADGDPTNNSGTYAVTVTGSYDPNDKLAMTSTGNSAMWTIGEDEWIDYTIRFQNTGTDTAFHVVIRDTLRTDLDPATLVMGAASHAYNWRMEGPGILKVFFPNILLPDSNVNEPLSHGFVSFRIRPHQPVAPGTVIENIANIYFDFNPPVITEPSVLEAEFSTGVQERSQDAIRMMPNPVNDELRISSNSGIASLRIIAADGREVLARTVRAANTSIAVDRLQAGAYLLHATFTDGTEARERFIKH